MDDPFKPPPQSPRLAKRIMDLVYGHDTTADERVGIERAERILDWSARPYHKEFLAWLRQEADKPMPLDVHAKMIVASTRSNTLREVLQRLDVLEKKARATIDREVT